MRFSENFEAAKNMAVEAAQTAAAKAKELAAVAKANIAIYAEEDKVKKAEIELGKLYYHYHICILINHQDFWDYLPMTCLIASHILNEIHIAENIEISFDSYDTRT